MSKMIDPIVLASRTLPLVRVYGGDVDGIARSHTLAGAKLIEPNVNRHQ